MKLLQFLNFLVTPVDVMSHCRSYELSQLEPNWQLMLLFRQITWFFFFFRLLVFFLWGRYRVPSSIPGFLFPFLYKVFSCQ
jgi:hypothetical protein